MDEFGNKYNNFQDGESSDGNDNGDSNSNNGDDAEDLEIELAADDKNLENNQNSMTVQNVTISPGNSNNNDDQDESFSDETCNSSSRINDNHNNTDNNTSAMIDSDIFDETRDLRTPTVDFFECESNYSSIEELVDYGNRIGPPDDYI